MAGVIYGMGQTRPEAIKMRDTSVTEILEDFRGIGQGGGVRGPG